MPFFESWQNTWLGEAMRGSRWLFPAVESVHLLGMALLLGTVLIVNLRFFGLGMRNTPASRVARQLASFTWGSLCVMLLTGPVMFMTDPVKYSKNVWLWTKIGFLIPAILFQLTVHRKVAQTEEGCVAPRWGKLVAGVMLFLWFGVALAGRAIGDL
jgi:Family of unknown function (DUF6644)